MREREREHEVIDWRATGGFIVHVDKQPAALLLRLAHWPLPPPHITSDAMRPLCCREQSRAERRALQSGARITRVGASQSSSLLSLRCAALLSVFCMCKVCVCRSRLDSTRVALDSVFSSVQMALASHQMRAMRCLCCSIEFIRICSGAEHIITAYNFREDWSQHAMHTRCTVLYCSVHTNIPINMLENINCTVLSVWT